MGLFPLPLSEWFRRLRRRFFMAAMGVTAEEAAADLEAESLAVKKRRVATAFEGLDLVRELATNDEDKAAILDAFKADLLEARNISTAVLSGRVPFEEGLEDLRAHPPESGSSAMSLPDESQPTASTADEPKAPAVMPPSGGIPSEPPAPEPPRRPRGRPPGSKTKNRPKTGRGGENGHALTPGPEGH